MTRFMKQNWRDWTGLSLEFSAKLVPDDHVSTSQQYDNNDNNDINSVGYFQSCWSAVQLSSRITTNKLSTQTMMTKPALTQFYYSPKYLDCIRYKIMLSKNYKKYTSILTLSIKLESYSDSIRHTALHSTMKKMLFTLKENKFLGLAFDTCLKYTRCSSTFNFNLLYNMYGKHL